MDAGPEFMHDARSSTSNAPTSRNWGRVYIIISAWLRSPQLLDSSAPLNELVVCIFLDTKSATSALVTFFSVTSSFCSRPAQLHQKLGPDFDMHDRNICIGSYNGAIFILD